MSEVPLYMHMQFKGFCVWGEGSGFGCRRLGFHGWSTVISIHYPGFSVQVLGFSVWVLGSEECRIHHPPLLHL